MPTVVGVKLRFAAKVLSFDPANTSPEAGDTVIVETERGSEVGEVAVAPHEVPRSALVAPLKPVVRVADEADLAHASELRELEHSAMPVFRELVKKHKLDMKPVAVEYLFDGSKVVFYFSAEERVDFRELVRELAAHFKARIDMRQVGVRDEARMVGGIGHCGQPLCCVRFAGEFQPVSIRMAKEQDLPLNPLKISGLCGRLMCCLRYEYDAYKDYKSRAPKRRAIIETPLGLAKVSDLNTPKETVTVKLEDGQRITVPLCSMKCGEDGGRPCSIPQEALVEVGAVAPVAPAPPVAPASPARSGRESGRGGQPSKRRRGKNESSGAKKESGGGAKGANSSRGGASGQKKTGGSSGAKDGSSASKGATSAGTEPKSGSSGRRRRRRRPPGGGTQESSSK